MVARQWRQREIACLRRFDPSYLFYFGSWLNITCDVCMKERGFNTMHWFVRCRSGKNAQKISLEQGASEFLSQFAGKSR